MHIYIYIDRQIELPSILQFRIDFVTIPELDVGKT